MILTNSPISHEDGGWRIANLYGLSGAGSAWIESESPPGDRLCIGTLRAHPHHPARHTDQ